MPNLLFIVYLTIGLNCVFSEQIRRIFIDANISLDSLLPSKRFIVTGIIFIGMSAHVVTYGTEASETAFVYDYRFYLYMNKILSIH